MKETKYDVLSMKDIENIIFEDVKEFFKPQNASKFSEYTVRRVIIDNLQNVFDLLMEEMPYVYMCIRYDGVVDILDTSEECISVINDVFRYNIRFGKVANYEVIRYDYSDRFKCSATEDSEDNCASYDVVYGGVSYTFRTKEERDLAEAIVNIINRKCDDVSGTEFCDMIKYVFRLLDVDSVWCG